MIQYIPRVFKQFTDEDYLRGAVETANWLTGGKNRAWKDLEKLSG